MEISLAPRLREALTKAGFTYDAVAAALGPHAHAALGRNETRPGLRATEDGSPLSTLTRLFLLQAPVSEGAAELALPGLVKELVAEGFVERSGGEIRALLDVRPYATEDRDLWVVSDLTPGLDGRAQGVTADHVLGISPAATSLAQLTGRRPVGRALDLGTGCGVQALHLAAHADAVVATDVNERALALTRFNLELNDVPAGQVDVRAGSWLEPVARERFDLVVSNPPFVISPAREERLVYRDSGLPGDDAVARLVAAVPDVLAEGGTARLLANWMVRRDEPWESRLTSWIAPGRCDAWVVQREVIDPAAYVELWLKDAGVHPSTGGVVEEYAARYDAWLGWFEEQSVEAIGFGWINLRRGDGTGRLRLEEWAYDVEQPIGPEIDRLLSTTGQLDLLDDETLLAARPAARSDLRQETFGEPGAEDPAEIVLRQQRGLRRARQVDTVAAGLVGALDGELAVGQVLDALAALLDRDPVELRASYLPLVRELLVEGYLRLPAR